MSEAELVLVEKAKNCTLYAIQFITENDTEFEQFSTSSRMTLNSAPT